MRTRAEITEELEALDQTLQVFDDATAPGSVLMKESLDHRREVLIDELERASASDLMVRMDGSSVDHDGSIAVGALAGFLQPFQGAVHAAAQAISAVATRGGLIERSIRADSQLRLHATFAGSFGLELSGPRPTIDLGPTLFDVEPATTVFESAVGRVLDVIEAASDPETYEVEIVNQAAELGQRTTKHLLTLSNAVISQALAVEVAWSPPTSHQRNIFLSHAHAGRLVQTLNSITTEESQRSITGRLVEASLPRRTFGVETDDGTIVRGSVDQSIAHRIEEYFGKTVSGEVAVLLTRSTLTDRQVEKFTLTRFVGPIEDETPSLPPADA